MYRGPLGPAVLDPADLEVNVLEFRQRAFQFDRLAEVRGTAYAVFSRTETESESQFRPKLLHLRVAAPHAWVVYDEPNDVLRISRDGETIPLHLVEPVVEVGAEPAEFEESSVPWRRAVSPGGAIVYAPAQAAADVLSPPGFAALGIP